MFSVDKRNNITLTIGDTATFNCSIEDLDGDNIVASDKNTLTMYIDDIGFSKEAIVKDKQYIFIIDGSDTSSIDAGVYMYRIVYETEKGNQYTILQDVYIDLLGDKTE